jgi:hypothetical protein
MSEMARALKALSKLPQNVLMQGSNGKWFFRGSVRADLLYLTKDGKAPSLKDFQNAASFGAGIVGLRSRVWNSEAEALEALNSPIEIV